MNKAIKIESLVGETLSSIDVFDEKDSRILLTTVSGRQILIHHEQDCCECVEIEDTEGEWHTLIGKPIILAEKIEEQQGLPEPSKYADCWTRTKLTFKTDDATVISRWIGESNGYYSESVDISEITKYEMFG